MLSFFKKISDQLTDSTPYSKIHKNDDGSTWVQCPTEYGFDDGQELHAKKGATITEKKLIAIGSALKELNAAREEPNRNSAETNTRYINAVNNFSKLTEEYGVSVKQKQCVAVRRQY